MSISPNAPHSLFISVERNGVFEIEQWKLVNNEWKTATITSNSMSDQIRPVAIKNNRNETMLLWNSVDKYIHYTNFHTAIKLTKLDN